MSALSLLEDRQLAEAIALCEEQAKEDLRTLALGGKLDWSPKKNWVEKAGGLPSGIESMAIHIMKSGLGRSHAIAAAVERAKKLAAMGKARWIKEVEKWEALKAKNKAMQSG